MSLRSVLLAVAVVATCVLHGGCEEQKLLKGAGKVVLDFDDLSTDPQTGIGYSSSFGYKGLNVHSFTPVNIVDGIGPPQHRIDVQDADCMTSFPNVLVGKRNDPSQNKTYWPSLSTCNYLEEGATELVCSGTFSVKSFSIKPMGYIPSDEDGNGKMGVTIQFDFIRLLETKKTKSGETDQSLPPIQPWFPADYRNRTIYALEVGFWTQGHSPPWQIDFSFLGVPEFATGIDTVEIAAESAYLDDPDRRPVDWSFCIDDVVLEFDHEPDFGATGVRSGRPEGVWREKRVFGDV